MQAIISHFANVKNGLMVTLLCAFAHIAQAQDSLTLKLYDGVAPGSENWQHKEVEQGIGDRKILLNVTDPTLTVHLPDARVANGSAIVFLPGGALRLLSVGQDMKETIAFFNERGVAVIVLKYRTLQLSPEVIAGGMRSIMGMGGDAPTKKLEIVNANANPAPDDEALNKVLEFATADAQAAMRMIRARAGAWRIDPARVGMLGVSAGGGVAMGTILAGDKATSPAFFISIYGPSLQDVTVPEGAPPLFLAVEAKHGPVTDGIFALYDVWRTAGKAAELHVYDVPTFAMPVSLWGPRAYTWMGEKKLLKESTE